MCRAARRASTIVTSNRSIDEWIPLFDDPILAQSALDRLAPTGGSQARLNLLGVPRLISVSTA